MSDHKPNSVPQPWWGRILVGFFTLCGIVLAMDFFGRPASTARGPAVLSMRAGVVLATFCAIRLPGWRPRYEVRIEAVPEVEQGSDRAAAVMTLTRSFTSRLEEQVRKQPWQYFWHHRRWKTPPPEEDTAT